LPEGANGAVLDGEGPIADRDLVRRLVERVAPKVRSVAWLYHIDGLEQEEVALVLDISRRTVATRLAAFLTSARKFMRSQR
jgi:DNA-directed RNA polymerase specialized sigma24 family protein